MCFSRVRGFTNWIRLLLDDNKAVFEYEVKFEPQCDTQNLRFVLMNRLQDRIGFVKSFDGSMLWLPKMLPQEVCKDNVLCRCLRYDNSCLNLLQAVLSSNGTSTGNKWRVGEHVKRCIAVNGGREVSWETEIKMEG